MEKQKYLTAGRCRSRVELPSAAAFAAYDCRPTPCGNVRRPVAAAAIRDDDLVHVGLPKAVQCAAQVPGFVESRDHDRNAGARRSAILGHD